MTLGEHLDELRTRVVRALAAIMVGAIVCYLFIGYIMGLLLWPVYGALDAHRMSRDTYNFSAPELFLMELKVAFIAGFILTAPYALVQIWGFVAAGLYATERKWVRRFVPVSIAMFFVGAFFMLFVVAPVMMDFFLSYRTDYPNPAQYMPSWMLPDRTVTALQAPDTTPWPTTQPAIPSFLKDPEAPPEGQPWLNRNDAQVRVRFGGKTYAIGALQEVTGKNRVIPLLRVHDNVLLILQMMAAFGIGFQMPVVVSLIATMGLATAKDMAGVRRHVYFVVAIASAVITPSADVFSMMALMLPMAVLYEIGLFTARAIERERAKTA